MLHNTFTDLRQRSPTFPPSTSLARVGRIGAVDALGEMIDILI